MSAGNAGVVTQQNTSFKSRAMSSSSSGGLLYQMVFLQLHGCHKRLPTLPVLSFFMVRVLPQDLPQLLATLLKKSPFCLRKDDGSGPWRFQDGQWLRLQAKPEPLSELDTQMWATLMILLLGRGEIG